MHYNIVKEIKGLKLIKRYKNRRLYDTELKQIIKLDDIRRYVNDGVEIKVIDNADGKDITVQTLVTAISSSTHDEKSLNQNKNIIKQLLVEKGGDVMDAMKKLMLAAMGAVHISREKMEEMFDELVKKGEMTSGEKAEAMKKMAEKIESSAEKIKDTIESKVSTAIEKFNVNARVDELNKKVDELSAKIEELSKKLSK
jgi:polyhydroxyalkanoate synthesis repressor PhaR